MKHFWMVISEYIWTQNTMYKNVNRLHTNKQIFPFLYILGHFKFKISGKRNVSVVFLLLLNVKLGHILHLKRQQIHWILKKD